MKRFKVVFLGADAVGKTSIIQREINNTYSESYIPTLGCDFYELDMEKKYDKDLKLFIWDIASQEVYKQLQSQYLMYAHACIIVGDNTRHDIEYFRSFIENARKYAGENVELILVINKIDLVEDEKLIGKIAEEINKQFDIPIILTSAKLNRNITRVFSILAEVLEILAIKTRRLITKN